MHKRYGRYVAALAPALIGAVHLLFAAETYGLTANAPVDSTAKQAITVPEHLSIEQIDALLATLTDAQARQALADELHRRAEQDNQAKHSPPAGFGVALVKFRKRIERLSADIHGYGLTVREGISLLPGTLSTAVGTTGGDGGLIAHLSDIVTFLLIGFASFWIVRHALRPTRSRLEALSHPDFWAKIIRAVARLFIDAIPVIAFAVMTLGIATAYYPVQAPARDVVIAYLSAALIILSAACASRFMFAPFAPALRLVALSDLAARALHRWNMYVVTVGTVVWLTTGLIVLTGVPMSVHLTLVLLSGLIMVIMAIPMIIAVRSPIAAAMSDRSNENGQRHADDFASQVARIWHWLALGYLLLVYLLWSYNMLARNATAVWAAIASVAMVVLVPLLDRGIERGLRKLLQPNHNTTRTYETATSPVLIAEAGVVAETTFTEAEHEARASAERRARYCAVALSGVRVLYGCLVVVILLALWGVDLIAVAGPEAATMFWTSLLEVALTLLIAYLAWRLVKAFIDPKLPRRPHLASDEEHSAPQTRTETLLPLLRTTVLVLLIVFTTLIVLANLGVEIAPLLAGAGVVGLAIGFGAQTLVKDIVSGIFFLIDDAFRVGEYVEFGELRGEVESISLRSLKLRHHRGPIHTVPFGELRSVTNHSRDWVIYKMEFRLPADTDIERVRKLIKKIGQELLEHPEHGEKFLQPLKSQGIHRVEENAIILRTKFMCKPREQFIIRRDAFRRIKEVFAENGIEFAPRTVRVTGSDAVTRGSATAASGAIIEAQEQPSELR